MARPRPGLRAAFSKGLLDHVHAKPRHALSLARLGSAVIPSLERCRTLPVRGKGRAHLSRLSEPTSIFFQPGEADAGGSERRSYV
jgi:hypothetical protein